jgi:Ca2+-binding RTX toxin-like protein
MTFNAALWVAEVTAHASYGNFPVPQSPLLGLTASGLSTAEATRLAGITASAAGPFFGKYNVLAYQPNTSTGFSATLFGVEGGTKVLAIRGTDPEGVADYLQDVGLVGIGFANYQAISMYRFYRELTTPQGESVQYTTNEIELLHRLNNPNILIPGSTITNQILDGLLADDKGWTGPNVSGSILQPGEALFVTGHSLGGHLAVLFGRLFPGITRDVYTFNAPGITRWGEVQLTYGGVGPSDPAHVFNFVADYGLDITAALGTRPGGTERVFIEGSPAGLLQNHKIDQLTDSLALYDLLSKLSPGLAHREDQITAILAGASVVPGESLERTLDLVRGVAKLDVSANPTGIGDRDAYYTNLYAVRDGNSDHDWHIESLAGRLASELEMKAMTSAAWRYALLKLSPFVAEGATYDDSSMALSSFWIDTRAEFLVDLLQARSVDRMYGFSGNNENKLIVDVDLAENFVLIGNAARNYLASNSLGNDPLLAYLNNLTYHGKTVFGSDKTGSPDSIIGTNGDDIFFGNAGNDTLVGSSGKDYFDGGAGSDSLAGGTGFDTYEYTDAVDTDTISDSDGHGAIEIDGVALDGGDLGVDDLFYSADGAHTYELIEDVLIVDGELTIDGFSDGDLGIFLHGDVPSPIEDGTRSVLVGDLETFDPDYEFHIHVDAYGNPIAIGGPHADNSDIFYGLPGDTAIYGLGGSDFVWDKWGGDDWIEGGTFADIIFGGAGDDVLFAEFADTDIDATLIGGGANADEISGGDGADLVFGSSFGDFLEGGGGADTLVGGSGDDGFAGDGIGVALFFSNENWPNSLPGGNWPNIGLHQAPYSSDADAASSGDDSIDAGAGSDAAFGGHGNDTIDGGDGHNTLDGGLGDDLLISGDDTATLYGDGAVNADGTSRWFTSLPYDPATTGGNDTLVGKGQLFGQAGDDEIEGQGLLSGGAGDDEIRGEGTLSGGPGDDSLYGGDANDALMGGLGEDYMDGGAGFDSYLVGNGDTVVLRGDGRFVSIAADGTFPEDVTFLVDGVEVIRLLPSVLEGMTTLGLDFTGGAVLLAGSVSDWEGAHIQYEDGTTVQISELQRIYNYDGTALPFELPDSPDHIYFTTEADDHLSGGDGADEYMVFGSRGGHDTIFDQGQGFLYLLDFEADEIDIFVDGDDYLLIASDTEIRLIGQADGDMGVDAIFLSGDGTFWSRADIEALAVALPEHGEDPLPIQSARAGIAFSYALPEGLFGLERAIGTVTFLATDLYGAPLPEWMHFDAEHHVLSGTPGAGDIGVFAIALSAADESEVLGLSPLIINIEAAPDPLFTTASDHVDFNALSTEQLVALEVTTNVHDALAGNDAVVLPNSSSAVEQSGFVAGKMFYGRNGNDTITGGRYADKIDGGDGNDSLIGGTNNDALTGRAGDDILSGQAGNDNLQGALGKDRLDGGAGNDSLIGGPSAGTGGDNDVLAGGDGNDRLQGGIGLDRLSGGLGRDVFVFTKILDTASTLSKADVIQDFQRGSDLIDLSAIDAKAGSGNQAFHYVGAGAFGAAGDLRAYVSAGQTIIAGDIDGDGVADFRIRLDGVYSLTSSDFVL